MAVEIFYNNSNVSDDYYENKGEYFNVFKRVLWRTQKSELSVLSRSFGEDVVLDQRFSVFVDHSRDYIADFYESQERKVKFEFGLSDERFEAGRIIFSIVPDRIEIESESDDDKEATICLICKNKEFLISLIPD